MKLAIDHYVETGEDLKLKALVYLLYNIDDHFSLNNILSKKYDSILSPEEYGGEIPSITGKEGIVLERLISIEKKYGDLKPVLTKKRLDSDIVSADYLIENIDNAFKTWQTAPWAKDLSFNDFCEHVLPYRVDHEPLNSWRNSGYSNFSWLMDERNVGRIEICSIINDSLGRVLSNMIEMNMYPTRLTYDDMYKFKVGVCEDETAFATMGMRSVGLPVGIDFVPQWPWRSMGHSWNYLLLESGETIPFMGTETNPGIPHFKDEKKGKVFRKTYAKQEGSLALVESNHNLIPQFFKSPYVKDVTDLYADVHKVVIDVASDHKYSYLSVFDNKNWIPIDWAIVQNDSSTFMKVEGGIVYLPIFYQNGKYLLAQQPFLLTENGLIETLSPDFGNRLSLTLTRKYPLSKHMTTYLEKMRGGRFEFANNEDFSDAITFGSIQERPEPYLRTINNYSSNEKYRYVRYVSSDSGRCNMAILDFYGFTGDKVHKLEGKIIGTTGSYKGYGAVKYHAFDDDPSTFFDAPEAEWGKAWIGLILDKPARVSHVNFMPRNDTNTIFNGQIYELFYWDKGWKGLGKKTGDNSEVISFENVPSNALYLLHNYSGGNEERIFVYRDNQVIWY